MKRSFAVAVLLFAAVLAAAVPSSATEATIALSGTEGLITLTATAAFTAYEHCDDSTPPECSTVNSGSLRVTASHPHNSKAFSSVYLTGNGSITWSIDLNCGRLAQGTHTFTAVATDSEGVTDQATMTLEIDNTPTVELDPVGPVEGLFDITGRARFKENTAGEEGRLYIYHLIPGYASPLGEMRIEGTEVEFTFSQIRGGQLLDAGAYTNGTHTFRARAVTVMGVQSAPAEIDAIIDNTPTLTVNPPGTVGGPFDIFGSATFRPYEGGPEGKVRIDIDGYSWTPWMGEKTYEGQNISWSMSDIVGQPVDGGALSAGPHNVNVTARAHNESFVKKTVAFTVDNTPVITMDLPAVVRENFDPGGSVTFKEVLSNSEGTIELFLDGVSKGTRTCTTPTVSWAYSDFTGEIIDVETAGTGPHTLRLVAIARNQQRAEATDTFEIEGLDIAANLGAPVCPTSVPAPGDNGGELAHATNHPFAGNPINFATGNKFHREIDFDILYPELPIRFERYYNSHNQESGLLGYGWKANFFESRITFTPGEARLAQADGREVVFREVAQGRWENSTDPRRWIHLSSDGRYYLHEPDRSTKQFDSSGRLRIERNPSGSTYRWFYRGSPWSVIYSDGPRLNLYTDGSGRLVRMTTPVGDFLYQYDAAGNLAAVEKPDGSRRSYLYEDPNDPHNLTGIVDETGERVGTYAYDEQDRAVLSERAGGAGRVTVAYGENFERTVTDSRGEATVYQLWTDHGMGRIASSEGPGCAGCGGQGATFDYDERFLPVRQTDRRGTVTEFTYDDRGNMLTRTEAVGTAQQRTTTYTWDPNYAWVTSITRTSVAAPGQTTVTTFTYDSKGNLLSRTETGHHPSGPVTRTTTWTWDAYGQVTSIDGPRTDAADVVTFEYFPITEDQGNNRGMLRRVTDPMGHVTTYGDYTAWRRPRRITDPNGVVTTLTYDAMGRLRSTTIAGHVTLYDHDAAGRLTAVHGPDGRSLHYAYTPDGLPESVTDDPGNRVVYTYDTEGNRIREEILDPDGNPAFRLDFDYDAYNRLIRTLYPDGAEETRTYDAGSLLTALTDAAGKTTAYDYDPLARRVRMIQPGNVVTAMGYDAHDNLTTVTDAEGRQTAYAYDDLGQRMDESAPDTGATTYQYDAAGDLVARTNANGTQTSYEYDAAGRLLAVRFADSVQDIVYTYDAGTNGKGRLTGMTDPSGHTAYSYDAEGRLTAETRTIDGVAYTTGYSYDAAGRLIGLTWPDAMTVAYERDAAGRVSRVTATMDGVVTVLADNLAHLPFGPLTGLTYGNAVTLAKSFDQRYRVTGITAATLIDRGYAYDATGNVTAIEDRLDAARSQVFTYDDLYRLTDATGVYGAIGYTYDATGNRLSRTSGGQTDTYTYQPGTSRLAAIDGAAPVSFSLDAAGNTVGYGARQLTYNLNNRLVSVTAGGTVQGQYVYNGAGQRIVKTAAGRTTIFHYDQNGLLIGESTPDGTFTRRYVYLDGVLLAAFGENVTLELAVSVLTDGGRPLEGVRVYAFSGTGAYTGKSATTDASGNARFALSELADGDYTFRADYLGGQYWSSAVTVPGAAAAAITVAERTATVTVTMDGAPREGVNVYLFDASGTYLGLSGVSDANGQVSFDLPADRSYLFRADLLSGQFWSDTATVTAEGDNLFGVATGGGLLTVTLDKGQGVPLAGVKTYLFTASGTYLGLSATSDDSGQVTFGVPQGSYKVRADYLGYQFWTADTVLADDTATLLSIPHQPVTVTVAGDDGSGPLPIEDVKVYLFTASGAYQSVSVTTDAAGEVVFDLPAAEYKVRADYLGGQFWSEVFNQADTGVVIAEAVAQVTVTRLNQPLSGVPVYVFSAAGTYLGLTGATGSGGEAVNFTLPAGQYNFRADYLGSQYFSGNTELIAGQANPLAVSTGGGNFTLTVEQTEGVPLAGATCYLFSAAGSYLGNQTATSGQGEAPFDLADGDYKIRIDHLGYSYWTDEFSVPAVSALTRLIAHQDAAFTVQADDGGGAVALAGVETYLFTEAGAYQGLSLTTDADGRVTYSLPPSAYKVRADYLGQQYWSDSTVQQDQAITIARGVARVQVSQAGSALADVTVYVFTTGGAYLGLNAVSDAAGEAAFTLPVGSYKFRADYQGSQYWATGQVVAEEDDPIALSTGGGPFTLTVQSDAGAPVVDVPVYVFSAGGSYLGLNARTDANGAVSFALADGGYQFRADYLGYQHWSNICTAPDMTSDVLAIAHTAVTVTVDTLYQAAAEPLTGVKVYLFTAAGAYQSVSATTDTAGEVSFTLPDRDYKVRADYLGRQFWSEVFNGHAEVAVDIPHGYADLHVTESGADVDGAWVYLFTEGGTYLSRSQTTDSTGTAGFFIPAGSYKFRVDPGGQQYWSDVVNILADEETAVDLALDLLALDKTRDPHPVRFDGLPPLPEKEPVLLASLTAISGLLVHAAVAGTDGDLALYYFVTDHLGTPQKVMNQDGAVVWEADYEPFGRVSSTVDAWENRFRFPGQYYDVETGSHYNWHRYYDLKIGRYLTFDPIGLIGGMNLYSYIQNNPINFIDPYGLKTLGEYWVPVEHFFSPFVIGTASIISGAWVGTGGALLTASSAAAIPETFGFSAFVIPIGVSLVAAGEYQVMFGTTTIINHVNNLISTDIPTLSDYSGLFPAFPSGHIDHHDTGVGDTCGD